MAPIPGVVASSITSSKLVTGDYESIATVSVGSGGASSITFSSIPSTYTHLQLRYIARNGYTLANTYTNSDLIVNSDSTASHYTFHRLHGDGATVTADSAANAGSIYVMSTNGNASANVFVACIVDILDYANTNKYKTFRMLNGYDQNGSGIVGIRSGAWLSTSAITSFTITNPASANWNQYSHFALYGIKS